MSSAAVTAIVREHLRPLLRERGFVAAGSTFRRSVGETVQVVQVQRSSRNGPALSRFMLNGSAYAPALDALLGEPELDAPDEPSCHLRLRPEDVLDAAPPHYDVASDADVAAIGAAAATDLAALLDRLDSITTTAAVADALADRGLAQYERVIAWYLSRGRADAARGFVRGLEDRFGEQPRWRILSARIEAVAERFGQGPEWLEG